jgi:RNA polymerase sigma-70 factor (ECF subfamily)
MDEIAPDSAETVLLLQQVQAGDRQAFERLFALFRPGLRQFVELRLDARIRARVDPSDVVQETHLEAFRRLQDFLRRRPMPFHLWLRKTAFERLLKIQRQHTEAAQRAVGREVALPEHSSLLLVRQLLQEGPSPSQHLVQQELVRRVRKALAQLGEEDREVLLMRNVEELSYQEVGCLLGIEPATARKRYGRALLRLRKVLVEEGLLESQP